MPGPLSTCLFCPNPANSREHIWADWTKDYVPKTQQNYHEARVWVNEDGRQDRTVKHRSGDPRSRKLKVVCARCNNEWMSRIQERAKPILVPLIRGEEVVLDASAQRVISGWAALLITIEEQTHRDWSSISPSERAWLKRHGIAPPNWRMWIGLHEATGGESRMSRSVLPVVSQQEFLKLKGNRAPRSFNGQTSTFLTGKLLIHALSAPRRVGFTFDPTIETKLRLICPPLRQIHWPPGALNDAEYLTITRAMRKRIWDRTGLGSPA